MKEVKGDLITLVQEGEFDVIIHGCNCFCTMNSGIAKQIKETFPEAYSVDVEDTVRGNEAKLGTCSSATFNHPHNALSPLDPPLTVVNAYTQYRYGTDKRHVDYEAIRSCFKWIKLSFSGQKIGYPKIGAGLAGGDWNVIKDIIDEELQGEDHTLVIFERD